jgi:hypothetical protein
METLFEEIPEVDSHQQSGKLLGKKWAAKP